MNRNEFIKVIKKAELKLFLAPANSKREKFLTKWLCLAEKQLNNAK